MNERQLEFNFPAWSQREDMITRLDFAWHLRLPQYSIHRGKIKAETLASVLAHIGKYPESYESQERVCQRLKIHERKLQRAIAVLRSLDILTTERKPIRKHSRETYNHHRINWEQVRRLIIHQAKHDQPDSSVGLMRQQSLDQPDSSVAINPTVLTDQPDSSVAINPTVLSPSLLERELECERVGSEFNTPPPTPPPMHAQEEEVGSANLVLIRTEKSREPMQAQALAALPTHSTHESQRTVDSSLAAIGDGRSLGSSQEHPQASTLARQPADLVRRYRSANVYDAEELLKWLLPEVGAEYLDALLAYWLANQANFEGAGALRLRLKRSRPDLPIAEGWPPMRHRPPIPQRKTSEQYAAERNEYRRARAEAQQAAATEPSMGDLFRQRQRQAEVCP